MSNHMNEAYDHADEFERDIKPHIDAIWQRCGELRIPCVLAVCYANTPDEDGKGTSYDSRIAVHLNGVERTLPVYAFCNLALKDSPHNAMLAYLSGALGDSEVSDEAVDETPAASVI